MNIRIDLESVSEPKSSLEKIVIMILSDVVFSAVIHTPEPQRFSTFVSRCKNISCKALNLLYTALCEILFFHFFLMVTACSEALDVMVGTFHCTEVVF